MVALYGSRGGKGASAAAASAMFELAWDAIRSEALTASPTSAPNVRRLGGSWVREFEDWEAGSPASPSASGMSSTRRLLFPSWGLDKADAVEAAGEAGVLGDVAVRMRTEAARRGPKSTCRWDALFPGSPSYS